MAALTLTPSSLRTLREAAARAYPEECCGLLIGHAEDDGWRVTRTLASSNLAADRTRFFEIDPALHIRLLRSLRAAGGAERVIGHYHSHPSGRAWPSARDLSSALDADALWLILGGRVALGPVAAWRPVFAGDRAVSFRPIAVQLQ